MHCYKIDGLNITAPTKEIAEAIARIAKGPEPRRLIIIPKDGSDPIICDLSTDLGFDVCVQTDSSIDYVGGLIGGTGQKLLEAAISSMDKTKSFTNKMAMKQRVVNRERKNAEIRNIISRFECTIPISLLSLYSEVMEGIDCNTSAYKLDMIDEFSSKGIVFKSDNWHPILHWFKKSVLAKEADLPLEKKRTFYQLRAAFVTAACRMVQSNVRGANSMNLARQADEEFDWNEYAEKDKDKS